MNHVLVLGGARSGKSRFAESLTEPFVRRVYLATAQARDAEMADRIARHQSVRDPGWATVEEPLALSDRLAQVSADGVVVLVDCLTLWLSNLMGANRDIAAATAELVEALESCAGPVVLVSNEVGLGVVPNNTLARAFRDHAGLMHQAVAAPARAVYFCVAGQALAVKPPPDGNSHLGGFGVP